MDQVPRGVWMIPVFLGPGANLLSWCLGTRIITSVFDRYVWSSAHSASKHEVPELLLLFSTKSGSQQQIIGYRN